MQSADMFLHFFHQVNFVFRMMEFSRTDCGRSAAVEQHACGIFSVRDREES